MKYISPFSKESRTDIDFKTAFLLGDLDKIENFVNSGEDFSVLKPKDIDLLNKKGKTEFLAKFLNLKKICNEGNQNSLLRCFINEEYDPLVTFLKFIEDYYVPSDIDGKKKFAIYDKGMNNLIGEGTNMFCCVKMDSLEGRSILESLMDQNAGTRRQREQLLHLLIKIIEKREGRETSEYKTIELLKSSLPSSDALTECIQSIQEKYSWGPLGVLSMVMLSFIRNIVMGIGMYLLDIGTDCQFSLHMYHQREGSNETSNCQAEFHQGLHELTLHCNRNISQNFLCGDQLNRLNQQWKQCFETGQRFQREYWSVIGKKDINNSTVS